MYKSIDHGNDATCHPVPVAFFVFVFLFFRKKIINVIVKNKSTTIFHGLPLIAHRNDAINCL